MRFKQASTTAGLPLPSQYAAIPIILQPVMKGEWMQMSLHNKSENATASIAPILAMPTALL